MSSDNDYGELSNDNNKALRCNLIPCEDYDILLKVNDVLVRCASALNDYSIINPLNKQEELIRFKEELSKGRFYSPILKYSSFDPEPYIKELEELSIPINNDLGLLFEKGRSFLLRLAKSFRDLGTDKFSTGTLFEDISEETINLAKEILNRDPVTTTPANKIISSEELFSIIKKELEIYDLKGWSIIFNDENASVVSVRGRAKQIKIRPGEHVTKKRVKKLLVHEIGTHVIRAVNGEFQEFSFFMEGIAGYLLTEEGLASYNEWTQNLRSQQIERSQALRVMATHIAETKGFIDVFKFVRPFLKATTLLFISL